MTYKTAWFMTHRIREACVRAAVAAAVRDSFSAYAAKTRYATWLAWTRKVAHVTENVHTWFALQERS